MKNNLIIFDCDGVLIDSEIITHRVGAAEMTRLGFPMTTEKSIEIFSGSAQQDLAAIVQQEYGKAISPDALSGILSKIEDSFPSDLKPITGISSVIEQVDKKYNKCIASNSDYNYIVNALELVGMGSYFKPSQIFNISMVKQGKPMPDLFLHAAAQCQVEPTNCMVIEDSVIGIRAAKAAKMFCIGFLGGAHTQTTWYRESIIAAKPDMIAEDALALLEIIARIG